MGTGLNFRNWVKKYPSSQDSWNLLYAHTLRYEVVPRLQLGWLEGTFHDKNGLTGNMATKRVFTTLYATCWLQSYNAINNEIPTSVASKTSYLWFVIKKIWIVISLLYWKMSKKTPISEAWPLVKLKHLPMLWKWPELQVFFVWVTGIF